MGRIFTLERAGRRGLSGSGAAVQECGGLQGWRENLGTCDATARRVSIGGREIRRRICDGRPHGCGDECGRLTLEFDWQSELQCIRVSLSRQRGLGGRPAWDRGEVSGSDEVPDLIELCRFTAWIALRWRGRRRK